MSDQEDDLEVQALQRELDDAFATTRPRAGFEDELWLRMQARRPAPSRVRDAIAGLLAGVRNVPTVPMAAVATMLVLVIGVGLIAYSGLGRGGGGAVSQSALTGGGNDRYSVAPGPFGRLPAPALPSVPKGQPAVPAASGAEYTGPAQLVWTGKLDLGITTAPVYRYQEPSTTTADQFAASLGAALVERPAGYLGAYAASTYTLNVRGTIVTPPASPAYFILSSAAMPPVDAAGAGPQQLADIFLAQHSLAPDWQYSVSVDSSGQPVRVRYERQFDVPGYQPADLVDATGARYGIEVDLIANRPVQVSGLLPVSVEAAPYPIVQPDAAIATAIASAQAPGAAAPTVQLSRAELVYVLVPAGDHSFYEPAYLFSGTLAVNGATLTRHVLVPAVDPSQRTP